MSERGPDLPRVPRAKVSGGAIAIGIYGAIVLIAYCVTVITGFQPDQPERDEVPASVRASPGGYRTYHFWHSGYHGGK